MALPVYVQDPKTGKRMVVDKDGNLQVVVVQQSSTEQTTEQLTRQKLFRGFLTDSGGSRELNVDASTSPLEFDIQSTPTSTRWITGVRVLLNDTDMELDTNDFRRFGSATSGGSPLTNGVELFTDQSGTITQFFTDPVTRLGEFMDYADNFVNFVNAITSQSDFVSFDFNFDVPVVLAPGSTDRVVCRINDDLTALDQFRVIVRGYQELL